jgi:hypothetical protein
VRLSSSSTTLGCTGAARVSINGEQLHTNARRSRRRGSQTRNTPTHWRAGEHCPALGQASTTRFKSALDTTFLIL